MKKQKKKLFADFSKSMKGAKLIPFGAKLFSRSLKYTSYRTLNYPQINPLVVRVSVTNLCDSRCKVCYIWNYYKKHPEKLKEEMTLEEFKKFVDSNLFLEDIGLTGGQLTLRKDIIDMWLHLDKRGYRTGGPTNAVNIDRIKNINNKALNKLSGENKHLFSISIDGLYEKHDYIRGLKGDFKKSLNLLRWARMKQKKYPFLDINVTHNITESNYKESLDFIDFFVKLGLKPSQIFFRPAVKISRLYNNPSKEVFKENKNKIVIEEIKRIQKVYPYYNNFFVNSSIKYLSDPTKLVIPCYASFSVLYIDPYWNVNPCMSYMNNIGNLRKNDFRLEKIWKTREIKEVQNNIKKGKCPNCFSYCYFSTSVISNPITLMKLSYENKNRLFNLI